VVARKAHRWLGLALLAPLVVWVTTGFLFHLKPGWSGAYEMISAEDHAAVIDPAGLVTPASALTAARASKPEREAALHGLELVTLGGAPTYRLELGDRVILVDATSAALRSPLDDAAGRRLAEYAAGRATAADRYGAIERVESDDHTVRSHFAGGAVVAVGRDDGRVSQTGPDSERIDWLYRLHYLQWTRNRTFDRVAALAALAGLLVLAGLGVVLLVRRPRPS